MLSAAVREIVRLTTQAFEKSDLALASRVEPLEELIDQLCDESKRRHIERLQQGNCTIRQGFVFNDVLTSIERVSDHCSNIAVAMLELEEDAFDTHAGLRRIKEAQSLSFQIAYEDYAARFTL